CCSDTAAALLYTLSLHDALPIWSRPFHGIRWVQTRARTFPTRTPAFPTLAPSSRGTSVPRGAIGTPRRGTIGLEARAGVTCRFAGGRSDEVRGDDQEGPEGVVIAFVETTRGDDLSAVAFETRGILQQRPS